MKITKLRLSGFKSFVEPTELELSPGLTGVVGPNGCGKSNLVDALKWVMGETSAKQLRGGEMDDVIFAGTASRPSRVFAEVSLLLDNQERKAPAQFNNSEALEVKRRIDRGEGSSFSVNDLDVRQRDVQTLFADASTGAHSTAIVSQGRIGSLINAKPTERRLVLEEAAGIVGLHARRHEAELKLNAAENNLKRVQDVLQALDVQMQGLKKQARQAAQYRSLADRLRKAEAAHFYHQWQSTAQNLAASQTQLTAADQELAARGEEFSAASAKQAEAAANLPPLRQAEAMRAAALQRLKLAEHELAQEEERLKRAQSALAMRQEQIAADMIREQELAKEGTQELARLMAEIEAGATAQAQEEQSLQSLTALVEAAQNLVAAKEQTAQDKSRAYAQSAAEEKSLTERIAGLISERDHLAAEAEKLTAEMEDARRQLQELDILNPARNRVIAAEEDLVKARSAMKEAEEARHRAFAEESAQRLKIENFSGQLAAARAEKAALQSMVGVEIAGETLADRTRTEDGYEAALAAALGDDLLTDEKGERKWVALPPLAYAPALPAGIRSLQDYVQAPAELARCLAQIGVVADRAEGDRYQSELTIGQRLVTQAGDLWRWDGFTVSAAATGMAAKRLEQRHRLKQVEKILNELTANQAQEEENLNRLTAHTQQIIEAETLAKK
ncbi:MAG: AAA family ATPase, partial [Dongiaceae bacterium]